MQIEITDKEKTALSILVGLRQKFAMEKRTEVFYTPKELHKLFSELVGKISRQELRYFDTIQPIYKSAVKKDSIWGVIDEAIERSKIKRYDWKDILGKSLTKEILILKKQGHDVEETFNLLKSDERVMKFIQENKREKRKILENLKISVHARFGENNTATKVFGGRI